MKNINKTRRLRGKTLFLEYNTEISCNELLVHLKSLFNEIPRNWKYIIKKEYYHEKEVSIFAFIEFEGSIDKYFHYFDIKLDKERTEGLYKAGVGRDITLFENVGNSMNESYLTNFPQDEINFYTRILITNEKSNESSLSGEFAPDKGQKSATLSQDGQKGPSEKQLKNILKFVDLYETESKKEQPDLSELRRIILGLRNYFYNKSLQLDPQLYETIKNIVKKPT